MKLRRCVWRGQQFSQNLKINSNNSDSPFTASYLLLLLSTRIFSSSLFSSQTTDLYCDSTPSQPSLSTNLSLLIQINKKFETQEHLQPICMREEPKKNGAQSLKRCLWSLLVGGCARDRPLQVWNSVLFTYFWFLILQNYCCCENWGRMERNGRKLRIFGVRFQNKKFEAQFSQNTKFWVFVRMFVWKFGKLRWVRIFSVIFRPYERKFEFLLRLNLCCVCYL